jgi:hypothetical protein
MKSGHSDQRWNDGKSNPQGGTFPFTLNRRQTAAGISPSPQLNRLLWGQENLLSSIQIAKDFDSSRLNYGAKGSAPCRVSERRLTLVMQCRAVRNLRTAGASGNIQLVWPLETVPPIYRTATPLPSKHPILYIFSTNLRTEFFKHAANSPIFFLFKMPFIS